MRQDRFLLLLFFYGCERILFCFTDDFGEFFYSRIAEDITQRDLHAALFSYFATSAVAFNEWPPSSKSDRERRSGRFEALLPICG